MFYCFLAEGFEETEALAPVDILRRAGVEVRTAGVGGRVITGSHGIPVTADMTVEELTLGSDTEGVILPGGMPGVKNLYADQRVRDAVSFCEAEGLYICAICAAPSIPGRMGVLSGRRATCFPGFEGDLHGAQVCADKVVTDGRIITAKGAGCALDFGFAITAAVKGESAANAVAAAMQC